MSTDTNVAVMRRWFDEVWNQGRVETIHELLADDFTGYGQDAPGGRRRDPFSLELLPRLGFVRGDDLRDGDANGIVERIHLRDRGNVAQVPKPIFHERGLSGGMQRQREGHDGHAPSVGAPPAGAERGGKSGM